MSRRTIALLLAIVAAMFIAAPSVASARALPVVSRASVPAFPGGANGVLQIGSRGPAVTAVQAALVRRGYATRSLVSGVYGASTAAAVLKFKLARPGHDLGETNRVGPRTYAALTGAATPTTSAKPRTAPVSHCGSTSGHTCKASATRGLYCPVLGAYIGDGFGAPRSGHSHQGVDLMVPGGTPIHAVESGVIIKEGWQSNGALVITQLGASGTGYYYGHNTSNTVHEGQHVRAGQIIGYSGDTGASGAFHVHFERRPGGAFASAVDPVPFIKAICF